MANTLYDFLVSESSSSATGGVNTAEGQDPSTVNDAMRQWKQLESAFLDDLNGVNTVTGTGDAIAVTLAQGFDGYGSTAGKIATGVGIRLIAPGTNTTVATLNVNTIGTRKIRKIVANVETALSAGDIAQGDMLFLIFRSTADSGTGAWILLGSAPVAAATTSASGIVALNYFGIAQNIGFAASVGSSALTVALKGANGSDPSATNPVIIPFRDVTAATGTPSFLTVTAATSIVISSGSTMGFTSAVIGRLWIVGFNDGGTFRLGLVNCLSGTSIMALRDGIYSSTAEGGAGAADSAQVIYTGTAVSSKAMTVLGYLEATEATAGTWATAPSLVQIRSPSTALPGDRIQVQRNETGAVATGTTVIPLDDTIPQNTEGDQYLSQAITPLSGANVVSTTIGIELSNNFAGAFNVIAALFRDSTANAVSSIVTLGASSTVRIPVTLAHAEQAGSSSATTFKVRAGGSAAGTTTVNGQSGTRALGGTLNSFIEVLEIMA